MSIGECINLIRVNHIVNGLLDIQDFISNWDSKDRAMVVNESGMDSYAVPATDQPSALTFEFFHSRNPRKRDPLMLPEHGNLSSSLRVMSVCSLLSLAPLNIRSRPTFLPHRWNVKIPCKVYRIIKHFG